MFFKWLIAGYMTLWMINPIAQAQINVCSSCSVSTIQDGINAASAYDTVLIEQGIYYEHNILLSKPLTLIGENGVIIDGEKLGTILKVQTEDVHISNLILKRVGISHTDEFAAVHVSESKNFTLNKLVVEDAFFGFLIEGSSNGTITNNELSGESELEFYSGNGVHAWKSKFLTITGNTIRNLRDGIYLEFVDNSEVTNNLSEKNIRYGLHFMFSDNNAYSKNVFKNNGAGVAVMFSKNIKMIENKFENNWGTASFGLLLKEINDAEITDNIFKENTVAIAVEGSSRINYLNNTLSGNGWGVKMSGGCYDNMFSKNTFSSNSFDVSFNSRLNDNKFSGNYWSTYSGYDLDKDGIGDVPHRPVKLFSYVVNRTPETMILLRSLFVDLINFTENVTPVFTPVELIDDKPLMKEPND
ncbi:MAG: nitrous oxide reductase family maturation protein NosD [Balneolaceae bacterium]